MRRRRRKVGLGRAAQHLCRRRGTVGRRVDYDVRVPGADHVASCDRNGGGGGIIGTRVKGLKGVYDTAGLGRSFAGPDQTH